MTQRIIKVILYTVILIILSLQPLKVWSQYGIGTPNPNASSILDLSAINKGVLLPRIALTGTNDIATITSAATSLLIYNTATAGIGDTSVSPGYYYWTGTLWQQILADNLGNHTATQDIVLGTHKIKGDGTNTFEISQSYLRFAQNQNADSQIRSWGNLTLWANDDNGGTEHMIFKVGGAGTGDERMRLDASGNLGIDVTSPSTKLDVNGQVKIRGGSPGLNKVLTSDENGLATWQNTQGDNMGNHIATSNIQLGSHYLSSDGDDEGLSVNASGNVGIGTTTPTTKLEVAGQVKITGGNPGTDKVLTSDDNGLASWKDVNSITSDIIKESEGYIPSMPSDNHAGITITSSNTGTATARNLFNEDLYYQTSYNSANQPTIQLQLSEAIKIHKYYLKASYNNVTAPGSWRLEGSNDGSNWVTLNTRTSISVTSASGGVTTNLSHSESYSYYKLIILGTEFSTTTLVMSTFQIYREREGRNLSEVLNAGENGGAKRIVNVSQMGINTTFPTATLSVNGDANKIGSTTWGTFSDIRLKDIQGNYLKGLQDICALHTITYHYKKNNILGWDSTQKQYGLIAQEVQHIFPEAVSTDKNGYLKLDVHPINMAVYNAIRELDVKNQILKQENQYFKDRIIKLDILEQELIKLKTLVKLLINDKK